MKLHQRLARLERRAQAAEPPALVPFDLAIDWPVVNEDGSYRQPRNPRAFRIEGYTDSEQFPDEVTPRQ